jgi:hypothetical protein
MIVAPPIAEAALPGISNELCTGLAADTGVEHWPPLKQAAGDLWYIDGPTGRVWIHEECHNFRLRYVHLAEDIR